MKHNTLAVFVVLPLYQTVIALPDDKKAQVKQAVIAILQGGEE